MKSKLPILLGTVMAFGSIGFAQSVTSDVGTAAKNTGKGTEKAADRTADKVK